MLQYSDQWAAWLSPTVFQDVSGCVGLAALMIMNFFPTLLFSHNGLCLSLCSAEGASSGQMEKCDSAC